MQVVDVAFMSQLTVLPVRPASTPVAVYLAAAVPTGRVMLRVPAQVPFVVIVTAASQSMVLPTVLDRPVALPDVMVPVLHEIVGVYVVHEAVRSTPFIFVHVVATAPADVVQSPVSAGIRAASSVPLFRFAALPAAKVDAQEPTGRVTSPVIAGS